RSTPSGTAATRTEPRHRVVPLSGDPANIRRYVLGVVAALSLLLGGLAAMELESALRLIGPGLMGIGAAVGVLWLSVSAVCWEIRRVAGRPRCPWRLRHHGQASGRRRQLERY